MKLFNRHARRSRTSAPRRPRVDPRFELFEDRVLLTGYVVNSAADTNTGAGNDGTLRYVLNQLATTGTATNEIDFNIAASGVQTIVLGADLPTIARQATIKGYTESGSSANNQAVGTNAVITVQLNLNGHAGLIFNAGSADSVVEGLAIFGGSAAGISVDDNSITVSGDFLGIQADGATAGANAVGVSVASGISGVQIGTTTLADRNLISGNTSAGVSIAGTAQVQGNLIGTDKTGLVAVPNQVGIAINGAGTQVGGTVAAEGNVISGNTSQGVSLTGASSVAVMGNLIGLKADDSGALGNGGDGVLIDTGSTNSSIGGTTSGAGNVIGGNGTAGIGISGSGTTGNVVLGNLIGTNSSGAHLGNADGVEVSGGASSNTIGGTTTGAGNTIGFNTQQGVLIVSGTKDFVHQNLYLGTNGPNSPVQSNDIVLVPGANNNQPAPGLRTAYLSGANLVAEVSGVTAGTSVELYQLTTGSPARRTFLGTGTVSSVGGILTVSIPEGAVVNGDQIVATASSSANGTSAFSGAQTVADLFTVININSNGVGSLYQAITNANSHAGTNTITFAITGSLIIRPTSSLPLPAITDAVVIDGTTETGVIIDGSGLNQDGLVLASGSSGSTIKGLTIRNFGQAGIHIESSADAITGLVVGASGLGNQTGILIDGASNTTIGGTSGAAANTIGFNMQQGIQVVDGGNSTIEGNYIGTDATSANQGNGIGIQINGSSGNVVGGTTAGSANTIGFSTQQGIAILSGNQNVVSQNLYVGANGPAIPVQSNDISLLPGANNSQPAPVLASASLGGGNLTVQLSVGVASGTSVDVELYQVDPSGPGQRTFLGSDTITTSAGLSSVIIPAGPLTNGSVVVATATVAANGTSAFSTALTIAKLFTVINTNASGPGSLAQAIINANLAGGNVITFAIPSGPLVISPTSAFPLPAITKSVIVDGTTEAGIIIDGAGLSQDGFVLAPGSDSSTIKGLTIQNFGKAAVHIQSSHDTIAGLVVGTTGLGNQTGIMIDGGSNVIIGGTTTAAANTIGFNAQQGIQILGGGNNIVEGNFIGTDAALASQGNGIGVLVVNSSGNTVGGTAGGSANTIGFNAQQGVSVVSGIQDVLRGNLFVGSNGTASPVQSNDITLGTGANNSQPSPTLASASLAGGNLTVQFSIGVPSGTSVDVELYQVVSSGAGQRLLLGSGTVTTSAGLSSLTIPASSLTNGVVIVATATVAANGTSAFSSSLVIADLYTVINTNPSGPGSLAQAIINANLTAGNTITFAIPSGPLVISPTAALSLPAITKSVTIDGTTEAGIVIDGAGLSQDGFILGAGSSGSTIKGLTIQHFGKAGLHIQSSGDTITELVVGTSGLGNQTGILIDGGSNVTIGGTLGPVANTIGFNSQQGIQILGGGNNVVEGNFIGTDGAGNSRGNGIGVLISGSDGNSIGGAAGNTIGFNAQQGVSVVSGNQNIVSQNSYLGTNGPGSPVESNDISLGAGANNNQPPPTLLTAQVNSGQLTLQLTALAPGVPPGPNDKVTIEVYSVPPATGKRVFLGSGEILAGNTPQILTVLAPGVNQNTPIIATATVVANGTSAFSQESSVLSAAIVTNTGSTGTGSLYAAIQFADANAGSLIQFKIQGTAPFVITPDPNFPLRITAATTVDGLTQPGVVIDGLGQVQDGLILAQGRTPAQSRD